MNADQQELNKFAKLSAHWWDVNGELRTLHQMNPLRLDYIKKKVPLSGKKVLDVGCGGGILTEALAKVGATVTGIDLNESLIRVAKLHLLEEKIAAEYIVKSVEALSEERGEFYDVITCLELLEHVPDPSSIVKACSQLLKPGGVIFFSTLNRNMKSYLLAILGAEYILKLLPQQTHDYAKFIKPSELAGWTRDANIKLNDMVGVHYNPFNKTFNLTNDVSVNYIVYGVKENA